SRDESGASTFGLGGGFITVKAVAELPHSRVRRAEKPAPSKPEGLASTLFGKFRTLGRGIWLGGGRRSFRGIRSGCRPRRPRLGGAFRRGLGRRGRRLPLRCGRRGGGNLPGRAWWNRGENRSTVCRRRRPRF